MPITMKRARSIPRTSAYSGTPNPFTTWYARGEIRVIPANTSAGQIGSPRRLTRKYATAAAPRANIVPRI